MTTSGNVSGAPAPTLKYVWGVIRFQPGTYISLTLARCLTMLAWLIPGLVMREFFNLVTHDAQAHFDLLGLIALLIGSGIGQVTGMFGRMRLGVTFMRRGQTLLQRNMFENIL